MMKRLHLLTFVVALALVGAQAWAGSACCGSDKQEASASAKHEAKGDNVDKAATDKPAAAGDMAACDAEKAASCSAEKKAACDAEKAASCSAEKKAACDADKKEAGACCPGKKEAGACCPGKDLKSAKAENALPGVPGGGVSKASESKAYTVGSKVSDISLPDAKTGAETKLSALAGEKGTVLVFWNQNCPFVVEAQDRIAQFHSHYSAKGIKVVAVDAGVNNAPEQIKSYADSKPFPVLVNRDSKVAASFAASRTPEVFFLDKDMTVVYHGAFDSGKNKTEDGVRKAYVREVAEAMLAGKEHIKETKAFGCSLKYAEGSKPL